MSRSSRRVLPGFLLSLGSTLFYLTLLVLLPLATLVLKSAIEWKTERDRDAGSATALTPKAGH